MTQNVIKIKESKKNHPKKKIWFKYILKFLLKKKCEKKRIKSGCIVIFCKDECRNKNLEIVKIKMPIVANMCAGSQLIKIFRELQHN